MVLSNRSKPSLGENGSANDDAGSRVESVIRMDSMFFLVLVLAVCKTSLTGGAV